MTIRWVAASMLLEYPGDLVAGIAHVRALAERFAHYATVVRADITHAADVEDAIKHHDHKNEAWQKRHCHDPIGCRFHF